MLAKQLPPTGNDEWEIQLGTFHFPHLCMYAFLPQSADFRATPATMCNAGARL